MAAHGYDSDNIILIVLFFLYAFQFRIANDTLIRASMNIKTQKQTKKQHIYIYIYTKIKRCQI